MGSQRAGHDWTTCTFLGPMWGISWIVHIIACLIGIIPQTLGRIDTFTEFIHSECYQMSGDSSVPNAASLALLPIPQGLCETMNEDENPRFLWKFGNGWEREERDHPSKSRLNPWWALPYQTQMNDSPQVLLLRLLLALAVWGSAVAEIMYSK